MKSLSEDQFQRPFPKTSDETQQLLGNGHTIVVRMGWSVDSKDGTVLGQSRSEGALGHDLDPRGT